MIESLEKADQELFLLLNGFHHPFIDEMMYLITFKFTWIPFYLLILWLIYKNFRMETIFILIAIGIVIFLSDQTASGFMKPFFKRFRPCHDPELQHLVYLVKRCGGKYGFCSSHAANSFGLAVFTWLLFRKIYRGYVWIFLWAILVAYSRVYVGVHYPGDILAGGIVGSFYGALVFLIYKHFRKPQGLGVTEN